MFAFGVNAQTFRTRVRKQAGVTPTEDIGAVVVKKKISPDLEERTNELMFGLRPDTVQKVIIQLKSATPLNEMFGNSLDEKTRQELIEKEVENNQSFTGILLTDLTASGGTLKKAFHRLGLVSAELPLSQIKELIKSENVEYVSLDQEVQGLGHVGSTTGVYNTGISDRGDSNPDTWLVGTGIGVAVIDSGAYGTHDLFKAWNDVSKVTSYDFTGTGNVADQFGHGSHVASIISGDWRLGNGAYEGIASGVTVYSLKALDQYGLGYSSDVIAAIDWTIANKSATNIRVINMSLGTPAKDSYVNDPLCLAARRAVNAGIVVVASAGNWGKDLSGNKMYGGINSPGIEPSVITVGAVNTFGTDYRSDDQVATFSSRGPTRGYVTLSNGARKYDNLIKPDIVAPGNRIIAAQSPNNTLVTLFPDLNVSSTATQTKEKLMYLSGTSMAAPVVAGAAALLIDTNPTLTPNLVKAILQYTAQPINGANTLEQGTGLLNIDGAVRVARLVKQNPNNLSNGNALLTDGLPKNKTSVIAGQTIYWGKGVITNFGVLYGDELMTKWQAMYANGVLISDGTIYSGSTLSKVSSKTTSGVSLLQGARTNNGVLVSDGVTFLTATAMAGSPTPFINTQGVLVSDTYRAFATQTMRGDNTTCMMPAP